MGRAANPAHRAVADPEGDRRKLPEVHLDYAYLKREDSDELATVLVAKLRPSRAIRAWVVPSKGVADPEVTDRLHKGIVELGIRPPCIFKSDGEASIKALREELMRRAGSGAVSQTPPVGESESNGAVENAINLVKGMARVHLLSLEAKLGVHIPVMHPIVLWMVEFVGDVVSKYMRGQDGRTAFERLYGKPLREEGLEFGEKVFYRRPKRANANTFLECRLEEGIWLGRR